VEEPTSQFLAFLLGWGILRVVGVIPVLGGLMWVATAIVGLGALWVSARPHAVEVPAPPTLLPPTPIGAPG
jgi:hypothetical protein